MEALVLIVIGIAIGYALRGLINKEIKAVVAGVETRLAAIEAKVDVKSAVAAAIADLKKL